MWTLRYGENTTRLMRLKEIVLHSINCCLLYDDAIEWSELLFKFDPLNYCLNSVCLHMYECTFIVYIIHDKYCFLLRISESEMLKLNFWKKNLSHSLRSFTHLSPKYRQLKHLYMQYTNEFLVKKQHKLFNTMFIHWV